MAKVKKQEKSYADSNKERIEKMLDSNAASVKAVVANTVETRRIAGMLPLIDIIFNNARQQVGYKIEMESFMKLFEKFQFAEKALEEVIEEAENLDIFKRRGKSDFKENKDKIKQMLKDEKTVEEIAKELNIDEQKVKAWVGTINQES